MNAREFALKVITEIDTKAAYANVALQRELKKHALSDIDRRFATELVYGVVKQGMVLDWILAHYSNRSMDKVAPAIAIILRMGIYQLLYMDRVPASAACNESVKLARKYGHEGTVKFVNAVLRSAAREPERVKYPDPQRDLALYLSLRYAHPQWLVKLWLERLGCEATEALCRYNNEAPPLVLRTNTLRTNRDALMSELRTQGIECEAATVAEGIVCTSHTALNDLAALIEGRAQVQDESSMLVAHVVAPRAGETVIDACAAPGGKSTHLAALMGNNGRVVACDIYENKLPLIEENAARLGIDIIETRALDACELGKHYAGQADRVLVDAPCSGFGVLRRRPDARWRKQESMLVQLPILQTAILRSAAECVKPGGVLVYSTCTTEPEENEEVVRRFLADAPDFSLDNAGKYLPLPRADEMVHLWPHIDGTDGFFIARMVRR